MTVDDRGGTAPDRLVLRGIETVGYSGVYAAERRDGQRFVADVVLGLDSRAAAASDDVHDTVDYAALVSMVTAALADDPVNLIETLAERIARLCLGNERVQWVEVTVSKPDAPLDATVADVALTIHRRRQ